VRWPTFLMLAALGACATSTGIAEEDGAYRGADTTAGSEESSVPEGSSLGATLSENSTVSAESKTTSRPVPAEKSISILATGDVLPEGPVIAAAAIEGGFDFARLFEPVGALVAGVDLAICHLEIPIVDEGGDHGTIGRSPYGGNQLAAPHELADGLARTGFDRCSTASNHADDLAMDGVRSTLDALDAVGIGHSGTARSAEEATMWTQDVAGVSVAHLSYTTYSNNRSLSDEWASDCRRRHPTLRPMCEPRGTLEQKSSSSVSMFRGRWTASRPGMIDAWWRSSPLSPTSIWW